MIDRTLYVRIWEDLAREKNMVFLAGPRQVGKTTLVKALARRFANSLYFNWDIPSDKVMLRRNPYFFEQVPRTDSSRPLIVLDEIHKYKDWKNYLKGIYDRFHDEYLFLVSGSGRLDIYQRGGDSLAGRYLLFHLWPLTLAELAQCRFDVEGFLQDPLRINEARNPAAEAIWRDLVRFSGFPEPYVAKRATTWRRWSDGYGSQLIREDIRDLAGLKAVQDMEALYSLLPYRVGSPLSLNSLAEDLKVSYNTVKAWVAVLERFFLVFRLSPWSKSISRAIHKERKLYLFNVPLVPEDPARFENAVALELFRAVSGLNELGHGPFSLHYVRNKEKQEVDFLLVSRGRPFLLVETKLSEDRPAGPLRKFQDALGVPAVQLVSEGSAFRLYGKEPKRTLVAPAWMWLPGLP